MGAAGVAFSFLFYVLVDLLLSGCFFVCFVLVLVFSGPLAVFDQHEKAVYCMQLV